METWWLVHLQPYCNHEGKTSPICCGWQSRRKSLGSQGSIGPVKRPCLLQTGCSVRKPSRPVCTGYPSKEFRSHVTSLGLSKSSLTGATRQMTLKFPLSLDLLGYHPVPHSPRPHGHFSWECGPL